MKPKSNYAQKLLDPRWQKKRLEILSRDNWACQSCGDTKSTLHVHHISYAKSPWTIKSELLITYCDCCHSLIEELKAKYHFYKIYSIKKKPLTRTEFYPILFYCYSKIDGYLVCLARLRGNVLEDFYMPVSEDAVKISFDEFNKIKQFV